jgi:hypothetical protein
LTFLATNLASRQDIERKQGFRLGLRGDEEGGLASLPLVGRLRQALSSKGARA